MSSIVYAVKEGPRPGCYLSKEKALEANPGCEVVEFDSYKKARRAYVISSLSNLLSQILSLSSCCKLSQQQLWEEIMTESDNLQARNPQMGVRIRT